MYVTHGKYPQLFVDWNMGQTVPRTGKRSTLENLWKVSRTSKFESGREVCFHRRRCRRPPWMRRDERTLTACARYVQHNCPRCSTSYWSGCCWLGSAAPCRAAGLYQVVKNDATRSLLPVLSSVIISRAEMVPVGLQCKAESVMDQWVGRCPSALSKTPETPSVA